MFRDAGISQGFYDGLMDSPYRPGFGARPAVLVGRDAQLARAEAILTRVENSGEAATSVVFTGARGLGKTVTLGVIGDSARQRGFLVAAVSMDRVSDNVQMLAGAVAEGIAPLHHAGGASSVWQRMKERLAALSIEVNAGVVKIVSDAPKRSRHATTTVQRQVLAALTADAAGAAREKDRAGLVVLIDELQEAPTDQLVVLANAIQDATKTERIPLSIFAAGLPQTPELVMAAASFTERFDFRTLGRLERGDAERALIEPALALKVRWDPEAAAMALDSAGGSPYLIQYIGDEAWTQAQPRDGSNVNVDHAEAAVAQVRDNLDSGMFRGRWAKATPAEKAVISAIAQVRDPDGVASTADVSAVLAVDTRRWSMARRSLIDKGLVEPVAHGLLRFTMPGFGEFVAAQTDQLDGANPIRPGGSRSLDPSRRREPDRRER